MKIITKLTLLLIMAILSNPAIALSAAEVTIDTVIEKQEVTVVDGTRQTRFIESANVVPGETLRFTLQIKNEGDAVAENVVLDNPLPPNALYIADSATQFRDSAPQFSIDNGQTFGSPSSLTLEIKNPDESTETIIAPPEEYTHIRWPLPPLEAGAAGQVSFEVLIQ